MHVTLMLATECARGYVHIFNKYKLYMYQKPNKMYASYFNFTGEERCA